MASGRRVRLTGRLHRVATRYEDSLCQLGAVHTWHLPAAPAVNNPLLLLKVERCVSDPWRAPPSIRSNLVFRSDRAREWISDPIRSALARRGGRVVGTD